MQWKSWNKPNRTHLFFLWVLSARLRPDIFCLDSLALFQFRKQVRFAFAWLFNFWMSHENTAVVAICNLIAPDNYNGLNLVSWMRFHSFHSWHDVEYEPERMSSLKVLLSRHFLYGLKTISRGVRFNDVPQEPAFWHTKRNTRPASWGCKNHSTMFKRNNPPWTSIVTLKRSPTRCVNWAFRI